MTSLSSTRKGNVPLKPRDCMARSTFSACSKLANSKQPTPPARLRNCKGCMPLFAPREAWAASIIFNRSDKVGKNRAVNATMCIKTDGTLNFSKVNNIRSKPTQVIQITTHNHITSIFAIRTGARERPSSVHSKVTPVREKKISTPLQRHAVTNAFLTTSPANTVIIKKHRRREKRLSSNPNPVKISNISTVPSRVEGGEILIADFRFWILDLIDVS